MTAAPTAAPTLWDFAKTIAREERSAAQRARDAIRARDQERLEPILVELAKRRGPEGIIASEVINEAILRGVFTGQESKMSPRAYSWIGPWLAALARRGVLAPMTRAGIHVRRKAERAASNGNSNLVYLHPDFAAA